MPAWFLAYLGEVVPDDLVLTGLRVLRTGEHWAVHMAGSVQRAEGAADPLPNAALSLAALTNSLMMGPFHVRITNSIFGLQTSTGTASIPEIGQQSSPASVLAESPGGADQFLIEGTIR